MNFFMDTTITLTDMTGESRFFREHELYAQLAAGGFRLFGMDIKAIAQMRGEYQKLAGPEPMTEESVRATFLQYGPPR